MQIDWPTFPQLASLAAGTLIGLAVALLPPGRFDNSPAPMLVGAMVAGMTVFEAAERLASVRSARTSPHAQTGE